MSTTASNKITGMKANGVIIDEYRDPWAKPTTLKGFEMERLGKKDYAFYWRVPTDWGGRTLEIRYKCSWPEAKRRFALKLITERLMK